MASAFVFTESFLSMVVMISSVLIWYPLLNCSLRYEVLGGEIRNMGRITEKSSENMTVASIPTPSNFIKDLSTSIDAHLHLREFVSTLHKESRILQTQNKLNSKQFDKPVGVLLLGHIFNSIGHKCCMHLRINLLPRICPN